ncbi:MAG: ABC transporter, partial [Clostridia bacterium]|nr:ABC transporter [Clostridia bacterium]
ILDNGKIAAKGTPLELKNKYAVDYVTLYGQDEAAVKALGLPYRVIRDAARISVPDTAKVTDLIVAHPELFTDYEVTKGKIDDVFLTVTGKDLPGGSAE